MYDVRCMILDLKGMILDVCKEARHSLAIVHLTGIAAHRFVGKLEFFRVVILNFCNIKFCIAEITLVQSPQNVKVNWENYIIQFFTHFYCVSAYPTLPILSKKQQ